MMATVNIPSQSVSLSKNTDADAVQYTRLHITPFDQALLSIVIPSSVLPRARNISYHTIETFPDKRYGFVELPIMDADKVKKRLNGAVLKGSKVRIEQARPESKPEPTGEAEPEAAKTKKEKKKSKKRKREVDVIPGVELEDRKVKRGWTTSEQEMIEDKRKKSKKDKKDKKEKKPKDDSLSKEEKKEKKKKDKKKRDVKSKYTDVPECLFRTKLPDTGVILQDEDEASGHKKKKKRKAEREVVIHEFEKTTRVPSFLKVNTDKSKSEAVTYEDGVGWVDSKGAVVESAAKKTRPSQPGKLSPPKDKRPEPTPAADDDETSSSGSSSDEDDSSASEQEANSSGEEAEVKTPAKKLKVDTQALVSPATASKMDSGRPKSSGSMASLTIKIPPSTPGSSKVHPLEALYKRPKGGADTPAAQESQPFSFFDNDDIEEDDAMKPSSQAPMTPYTQQEFEYRNVRSAAPTPDTAHPTRSFNLWSRQDTVEEEEEEEEEDDDDDEDNDEEDQDEEDTTMADAKLQGSPVAGGNQAPVSDFQKQFWENRGDLNRKWRKRKKAASKEKRYRENRARAARAI